MNKARLLLLSYISPSVSGGACRAFSTSCKVRIYTRNGTCGDKFKGVASSGYTTHLSPLIRIQSEANMKEPLQVIILNCGR